VEAIWIVVHIVIRGTDDQLKSVAKAGALDVFCELLHTRDDAEMLILAFMAVDKILVLGKHVFGLPFMGCFKDKSGWLANAENLQHHESDMVRKAATKLIKFHGGTLDDDIDKLWNELLRRSGKEEFALPVADEENPKGDTRDANTLQRFSTKGWLGVVAVVYIIGAAIISMLNTEGRDNHRQFKKKTVYVKSSATKRLNQGKRLDGIVTRSGVQYIDFERKTGQPTAMYKIKASDGGVYVPVNIKGKEEAIEKAIASIKFAVGTENLDEEIELPPTNIQQASATEQVSDAPRPSAASLNIPKKRKKKESTIRSWTYASCQYLKEISIDTCKSSTRHIKNLFDISSVLCFIVYWSFDHFFDPYGEQSEELHILHFVFLWLVVFVSAQLLWHMYYGMSLAKLKPKSKYNIVKFSFGVCIILFVLYETDLLLVTVMNLLLWRGITNGICWLGLGKGDTNSRARSKKQQERKKKKKSSEEDAKSLLTMKEVVKTAKSLIVIFVILCCIELLKWRDRHENCEPWASQGLCEKNSEYLEYMMSNCRSSCAKAGILKFHWTYNLRFLLFLSIAILLLTRAVATSVAASLVGWNKACLLHEEFEKLLILPFDLCQEAVHLLGARPTGTQQVSTTTAPSNPAIPKKKLSKVEIVIFGSLCFVVMFGITFGFNGHSEFVAIMFFLGAILLLLWIPFISYQTMMVNQTIYIKSSKSKELTGQQARKMKEILNKSSLDKLQIEPVVAGDSHRIMHVTGIRRNVREAIGLIQEAVGKENVSTTKPSNTVSVQESASSTVNGSEPQPTQKESTTPESPVRIETMNDNGNDLNKEATAAIESPLATTVQEEEEEVPSEIGIIDSSQGMTTRDTITEASMSSLNDRSNASKAYSSFTLDENDPLLIFLRSQASCIKGSVDEFYTWLVKSEDIDSMLALKEAVNEDDYLNDMKVGDGGGSGIKGFKRKAFLRAVSEYLNNESDTKSTAEEPQSLPQCQKKNLSDIEDPPEELVCPISLNLMTNDPVVAADGITYERASIEDWFKKSKAKISGAEKNLKQNPQSEADQRVVDNGICSPVYGTKMESLTLMPNTILRNMARAKERNKNS